jgi:hypothetical protein
MVKARIFSLHADRAKSFYNPQARTIFCQPDRVHHDASGVTALISVPDPLADRWTQLGK